MTSIFKKIKQVQPESIKPEKQKQEEFVETPEICESSLKLFREALQGENDMNINLDDATLLRFLRAKSFKIPESVALARRSQQFIVKNRDFLSISFEDSKIILENRLLVVLKHRDSQGRRILYFRAKIWDPDQASLNHIFASTWHIIEQLLLDEETQRNGIILILNNVDVQTSKMAYMVSHFTLSQMIRMIAFYQGGYPVKVKGILSIETPWLITYTYNTVKLLLKKKLRDRIGIYSNGPESLEKYFNKEILPECLGGDLPFDEAIDHGIIKAVEHRLSENYLPSNYNIKYTL